MVQLRRIKGNNPQEIAVGIFGNKQQPDPVQNDDLTTQLAADDQAVAPASIDGFLPGTASSQAADPLSNSAPIVEEHMHDEIGSYIEAEPPKASAPKSTPVSDDKIAEAEDTLPQEPVAEPASASVSNSEPVAVHTTSPSLEDLGAIKQDALRQLSPLVSHLAQSPEEKFHTTMMMLQATDDHSLVKPAYEAAQAITDEKTRAQALLDIVNEINYFTQNNN